MSEPAVQIPVGATEPADAPSPQPLNRFIRWLCDRLIGEVQIAPATVARIRSLAERGTLAYVLRERSWVDYLLVTYALQREGLPAPSFANDMRALWMRPMAAIFRGIWLGFSELRPRSQELRGFADRRHCRELVSRGHPVLLFLRGRKPRLRVGRRRRLRGAHHGREYIREIVHDHWQSDREVFFVPLAPLRGRGMRRKESRLAALVYGLQETPSEGRRVLSLLWNRHDTSISAGAEVPMRDMIERHRREGEERTVRRLARDLQIYLYREERVVWGPLLLPKWQVRSLVLGTEDVEQTVRSLVGVEGESEDQLRQRAGRYIDEMAADFKKAYFSVLEVAFNWIFPRLFSGLEYSGLERVVECVKKHPVVLVPCHRSHFDYIILSYVFHMRYVSPPHIAAGINLSFWPLGPLFRGAGAYFIRRTFEGDELYKAVFRQYLTFLIREGYTQEFFIEGGRSRTGKVLPPKLGVLSAIVDAFSHGVRRDLYFVPVSIHYGRVVEEDAYRRELGGAEKQPESLKGLVQARRVLRRRHGTVYVSFAKPISLNESLGKQRKRFRAGGGAIEEEKRSFVRKFGLRLLREINRTSVVGATSVSATVLLGAEGDACRNQDFVSRARAVVTFLRRRGIRLTASLERNDADEFRESLLFLESGGLIRRVAGISDEVIHVPGDKRLALDFYKNNAIHFFLLSSLLLDAIRRGKAGDDADADVKWWLDLLRWEFPLPDRDAIASELAELRQVLRAEGVLDRGGEALADGHPFVPTALGALDTFREAYWVAARVLDELPSTGMTRKALLDRMHKHHTAALLLNEIRRPEGASSAIFSNALQRYTEIGTVEVGTGRDPLVIAGPNPGELGTIEAAIADSLRGRPVPFLS
jgi:glycerol-3-phosphate O-acyltransferase